MPLDSAISVIIPSYNQGRFIERTLQSVLEQSVAALECLVYDGGSQDETVAILRRYEDRVRWISEPDRGQSHAVNKGITVAKGEIIAWINSDDVYFPETFEKVQLFFSENQDVDVLYGDAFHIDVNDFQLGLYDTEPWSFERLKEICYLCQPAVFFRRRVVDQFGYLDEMLQFCMDYEFWLRLAKGGAVFAYQPVVLAGSRLYAENKTFSDRTAVHTEIIDMLAKKFDKISTFYIYNYAHIAAIERCAPYNMWQYGQQPILHATWRYKFSILQHLILAFFRWRQAIPKEFVMEIGIRIKEKIIRDIKYYLELIKKMVSR